MIFWETSSTKSTAPPPGGGRKHPGGDMLEIDTTNILFIAGGAFVDIDGIIKRRINGSSMGFTNQVQQQQQVTIDLIMSDDLVKYGMIPEFVGRFPTVISLKDLTRDDMKKILTQVKNNFIDQYHWLFQQDAVDFDITAEALDCLVDRALTSNTGARSLHGELERVLMPHMFDLVRYREQGIDRLVLTPDMINNPRSLAQGE